MFWTDSTLPGLRKSLGIKFVQVKDEWKSIFSLLWVVCLKRVEREGKKLLVLGKSRLRGERRETFAEFNSFFVVFDTGLMEINFPSQNLSVVDFSSPFCASFCAVRKLLHIYLHLHSDFSFSNEFCWSFLQKRFN